MRRRRGHYNTKRRLLTRALAEDRAEELRALAEQARYGGNPEHKRNPGDFGLTPAASPRPGKSLCDDAAITRRAEALRLLRAGLRAGLVSDRFDGDWPKNVWTVTQGGMPLEAQRESDGIYHGYPMPLEDPFRAAILERWYEAHE